MQDDELFHPPRGLDQCRTISDFIAEKLGELSMSVARELSETLLRGSVVPGGRFPVHLELAQHCVAHGSLHGVGCSFFRCVSVRRLGFGNVHYPRDADGRSRQQASRKKQEVADYSWSSEAEALLQASIIRKSQLTAALAKEMLKSITATDASAVKLGSSLRHLSNCTELTLTGNHLYELPGDLLPPKLQVLHACANDISTEGLAALNVAAPPTLFHVGVPLNQLKTLPASALSPQQWPSLLSLDISHNWLVDLIGTANTLTELPSLAVLQTFGNPIALLPEYRPYMVNRLPKIQYFDDQRVEFEERAPAGIPTEFEPTKEATVVVTVKCINGLAEPPEYLGPAHGEEENEPPTNRKAFSYSVGLSVPGGSVDLNPTQQENENTDAGEIGARTPQAKWKRVLEWPELESDGGFIFHCTDLIELKRACESGLTFGLYETMTESVVDKPTEDNGPKEGTVKGKKPAAKGNKGKGKDEGLAWKQLPPQIRIVGQAHLTGLGTFLENGDKVQGAVNITDTDGRAIIGYTPPMVKELTNHHDEKSGKKGGKGGAKDKDGPQKTKKNHQPLSGATDATHRDAPPEVPTLQVAVALVRSEIK